MSLLLNKHHVKHRARESTGHIYVITFCVKRPAGFCRSSPDHSHCMYMYLTYQWNSAGRVPQTTKKLCAVLDHEYTAELLKDNWTWGWGGRLRHSYMVSGCKELQVPVGSCLEFQAALFLGGFPGEFPSEFSLTGKQKHLWEPRVFSLESLYNCLGT